MINTILRVGHANILAALDVYRETKDSTDFLDTVQLIIERDDWTNEVPSRSRVPLNAYLLLFLSLQPLIDTVTAWLSCA